MTGKIVAPASAASVMLRRWMRLNGVSRTHKYQGPPLFQAHIRRALDQLVRRTVGDTRESAHAARQDNHGIDRVRSAGDVGADVGIILLLNLCRIAAQQLGDQFVASADAQLFRHHPQSTVGEDHIDRTDPLVAIEYVEQVPDEEGAAGAGDGDGQIAKTRVTGSGHGRINRNTANSTHSAGCL